MKTTAQRRRNYVGVWLLVAGTKARPYTIVSVNTADQERKGSQSFRVVISTENCTSGYLVHDTSKWPERKLHFACLTSYESTPRGSKVADFRG